MEAACLGSSAVMAGSGVQDTQACSLTSCGAAPSLPALVPFLFPAQHVVLPPFVFHVLSVPWQLAVMTSGVERLPCLI